MGNGLVLPYNRVPADLENLENSWNFVYLENSWKTPGILC